MLRSGLCAGHGRVLISSSRFQTFRKSYWNKAMLPIGWSLRSSRSGWPLRNIHISNDNGSFTFYVDHLDFFSPLLLPRLFTWLDVTQLVPYKKQELLNTWVHPWIFVGLVLLIFLVFCVVLLCVFTFWVSCCDVRYDFHIKTIFGSCYLQFFVSFALFLFVSVVFLRLVYPMLSVSLDCPFLIAPLTFISIDQKFGGNITFCKKIFWKVQKCYKTQLNNIYWKVLSLDFLFEVVQ